MTLLTVKTESAVRTYASLLLRLHALFADGREDDPEADAIRDQMDEPWYGMTEQEQERVGGLSEDLYALAEGGKSVPMTETQRQQWEHEGLAILQNKDDPDRALAFLRRPTPQGLPPSTIPFLQSGCWESLGDLEVSLRFMREAERLDPSEAASVLLLLEKLGRKDEAVVYANRIIENHHSSPDEVYVAAASLLVQSEALSNTQGRPALERITRVLTSALSATFQAARDPLVIPDLDLAITLMLAHCYGRLGRRQDAEKVCTEALRIRPENGDLLATRGLARLETDQPAALQDFVDARKARTRCFWAYYHLAFEAIKQAAYHDCWRLCQEGLESQGGTNQARAQLLGWLAISQAMLGQSRERVLDSFEQAGRLDPANEEIHWNKSLIEELDATQRYPHPQWKTGPPRIRGTEAIRWVDIHRSQDRLQEQRRGLAVGGLALVAS